MEKTRISKFRKLLVLNFCRVWMVLFHQNIHIYAVSISYCDKFIHRFAHIGMDRIVSFKEKIMFITFLKEWKWGKVFLQVIVRQFKDRQEGVSLFRLILFSSEHCKVSFCRRIMLLSKTRLQNPISLVRNIPAI